MVSGVLEARMATRKASVTSVEGGRRRTVDESKLHVTSVFQQTHEHAVVDHDMDADEQVLVALGYKQEFKREFHHLIIMFQALTADG